MTADGTLQLNAVEQKVLAGYRGVNPSKRQMTEKQWKELCDLRAHVFLDRLHVPPLVFRDARVLDIGCGTGEYSTVYATWGAKVHGVDFNDIALKEFHALAASQGLSDRITTELAALSTWDPPPDTFDIGIAHGVIHHTADPEMSVRKLIQSVRPGGFVIFSTAPLPGGEQRLLMHTIVQRFSKDLDSAVVLAEELFPEHLERSVRIGGRTPQQIVADNFLTVQNVPIAVGDALRWLDENDVSLYRSWPPLELHVSDHAWTPSIPLEQLPWREQLAPQARLWASQRYPAAEEKDLPEELYRLFSDEHRQVLAALDLDDQSALSSLRKILPSCRVFGHGTCGIGEWWVVGIKR